MKKNFPLLFAFIWLISSLANAQSLVSNSLGVTNYNTQLGAALVSSDGAGIYLAGTLTRTGFQNTDYFARYDTSCQLQTFAGLSGKALVIKDMAERADGNLLIAGYINRAHDAAFLAEITPAGGFNWKQTFEITGGHKPGIQFMKVVETSSGNIVGLGYSGEGHSKNGMAWVKTDGSGNAIARRSLGNEREMVIVALFAEPDGGVVIAASTGNQLTHGTVNPRLIKLDADGNTVWVKNIFLPQNARLNECIRTADGDYILAGLSNDAMYIARVDANLSLNWINTYSLNDIQSMAERPNGNLIIGGNVISSSIQFLIMEIDASGNILYSKNISSGGSIVAALPVSASRNGWVGAYNPAAYTVHAVFNSDNNGNTACPANDAAIALTPSSATITDQVHLSNGAKTLPLLQQIKFLSFDSYESVQICSPILRASGMETTSINAYPNPFTGNTLLSLKEFSDGNEMLNISITDASGKMVETFTISSAADIPVGENLPAGMYMIRIASSSSTKIIKVVKQ